MHQTLADALAERGYDTLTPVQTAVGDEALTGRDLLVSAQTGSGKTVGFGLAIAPSILDDEGRIAGTGLPLALVIAPTRELALQVKRELGWLYAGTGARMASCVGGMDVRDERRALERGAEIVVATPGRLRDHLTRGAIDLSQARAVVLDEADEMLDLGFREDLEFILSEAPADRRTLMFSATVPAEIERLAQTFMTDPERVDLRGAGEAHSDIAYQALQVAPQDEEHAVLNVLRYHEARTAIVFANTRAVVARLTARLSNRGFSVVSLSGELTQPERAHALQALRDGRARVCVATDVAARGLDLPGLDLVVHAELPSSSETLLHRSGRTGRAGAKGLSALIVPPKRQAKASRLLREAGIEAEWLAAPSADAVLARDAERLVDDPVWDEPMAESEADLVARLVETKTPEQISVAYLRLWRASHAAPEDLSDPKSPPPKKGPRAAFGPATWVALSVGRLDRAEPRWVLPMLCNAGGIDKSAIGAIRIEDKQTYIEVLSETLPGLLGSLDGEGVIDKGIRLTVVEGTPELTPRPPREERPARDDRPPRKPRAPRADGDAPRPARPRREDGDRPHTSYGDSRPPRPEGDDRPSRPYTRRDDGDRPKKPFVKREDGDRPAKPYAKRDGDDRPRKPYVPRDGDDRPKKPFAKREDGDRPKKPFVKREDGDRPKKPFAKRDGDDRPKKPFAKRDGDDRPKKPFGKRDGDDRPKKPFGKRDEGDQPPRKPRAEKPKADARDTSKRFVPPGGKARPPRKRDS